MGPARKLGGGGAVYGLRPVSREQVRLGVANEPGNPGFEPWFPSILDLEIVKASLSNKFSRINSPQTYTRSTPGHT